MARKRDWLQCIGRWADAIRHEQYSTYGRCRMCGIRVIVEYNVKAGAWELRPHLSDAMSRFGPPTGSKR